MQRCKAKSKRSGEQCKNYAIKHFTVCRMHGARGGPKTLEGYKTCKTAPHKHGMYSKESKDELKFLRTLLKNE
jgi:hypothetical protein